MVAEEILVTTEHLIRRCHISLLRILWDCFSPFGIPIVRLKHTILFRPLIDVLSLLCSFCFNSYKFCILFYNDIKFVFQQIINS